MGRVSRLNDGPDKKQLILVGLGLSFFVSAWPTRVQLAVLLLWFIFICYHIYCYYIHDRSKAVLLLWFLNTATCSCCPFLYFGSPIMLVTYFSKF